MSSSSRANLLPGTKFLEMCLYLLKETEVVPWAAALRNLGRIRTALQGTDGIPLLNGLVRHLISPVYAKVGWEDEGEHMERLLRKLVLLAAVGAEVPEAKERAVKMFKELKEDGKAISPNLRHEKALIAAAANIGNNDDVGEKYRNNNREKTRATRNMH